MFGPGPSKPASDAPEGWSQAEGTGLPEAAGAESDLVQLAAKFAAHGGGHVSSELSTDLALEIVLNEIVEQACLATGATGAAIVLSRDGEWVCRASSGPNAPELGARLDMGSGLSAECMRVRQVQRCDDAQTDPRADIEASRTLNVRSVMVLPLAGKTDLLGVFEIFSSRSAAFGERDERTLEALGHRVIKNLERAAEPPAAVMEVPAGRPVPPVVFESLHAGLETIGHPDEPILADTVRATTSRRAIDIVTWSLGIAVLAGVVLLGVLVGQRFGTQPAAVRAHTSVSASTAASKVQSGLAQPGRATDTASGARPQTNLVPSSSGTAKVSSSSRPAKNSSPPEGSLLIYENGKEVFRMTPSGQVESPAPEQGAGIQRASSVDPEGVVELSPTAAESSLLHRVEPDYPEEARSQQVQGPVVLDAHIGADGTVQDLKVVSGHSLLAQAAIDAVKQWRFKPRLADGRPVEMQTTITLNFRLPQ